MLPLMLIPLAIQAGKGIYDTIAGNSKAQQAKREQRDLEKNRPKYTTPQGELDSLSLLQSRAGQGLNDSTINQYNQQAERGLTSVLDSIIKGGGTPNSVSGAYQNFLDKTGSLQLANDQAQLQNINSYLQQQRRVSDYQDKEWDINTYAPWADKSAAAAQQRAQGEGQRSSGINTIASGVANYAGQLNQGNQIQGLFGKHVNLLGQPVANKMAPTGGGSNAMTNGQFANSFTGAAMGMNNGYFGGQQQRYSPNMNQPMGYDFSTLKPSDRSALMQLLGNY